MTSDYFIVPAIIFPMAIESLPQFPKWSAWASYLFFAKQSIHSQIGSQSFLVRIQNYRVYASQLLPFNSFAEFQC